MPKVKRVVSLALGILVSSSFLLALAPTVEAARCLYCYGSCPAEDNEYWCVDADCDVFRCIGGYWTPAGYKEAPGTCGCSYTLPPPPPPPQNHWECSNMSCIERSGPGTNECSYYASISDECSHLICDGMSCRRVAGGNASYNECSADTYPNISMECSHLICRDDACVRVEKDVWGDGVCSVETGPGNISNECTHLACEGLMCNRVSGQAPDECHLENLPSVICLLKFLDDIPTSYLIDHPNKLATCTRPVEEEDEFSECCTAGGTGVLAEDQYWLLNLLQLARDVYSLCGTYGPCPQSPIGVRIALTFGETFDSTERLNPTSDYFNRMFKNLSSPLTIATRFPEGEISEEEEKDLYILWQGGLVGREEELARGGHEKVISLHNSTSSIKGYGVRVPTSTGQLTPPKLLADIRSTEQYYLASFPPKAPDLQTQTTDAPTIALNVEPVNYSPAQPVVLGIQTICPPKVPAPKEQLACHLDSDGYLFPTPQDLIDAIAGELEITLKIPYLGVLTHNMTGIETAEDDPAREESDYNDGGYYDMFRNPLEPGYLDRAGDAQIDNLYLQIRFVKTGDAGPLLNPLIDRLIAYTQTHPFSIEFPGSGLLLIYMGLDKAIIDDVGFGPLSDPLTAAEHAQSL